MRTPGSRCGRTAAVGCAWIPPPSWRPSGCAGESWICCPAQDPSPSACCMSSRGCSKATRPGMRSMPGGAPRSSPTTTARSCELLKRLGFGNPGWQQLGWLLAGALTLWLLLIGWQFSRVRPARGPDRLARAYLRLCARLARYGPPRQPHQGPLAYAATLGGNCDPGRAGPRTAAICMPACATAAAAADQRAAARVRTAHQSLAGATSACSRVSRNVTPGQRSSVRCRFTREGARYTSAAP